jgi:hypothetical protein
MIEIIMLCGIGLLAGCLLMLPFFPLIHRRAVRLTKRRIDEATPMTLSEIKADKDHLRAEFAMSVRRLEIGMQAMRTQAASRYGPAEQRNAQMSRLQVELDKKTAQIFALRARADVRKSVVRRVVKVLLYLFIRLRRRRGSLLQPLSRLEQNPAMELEISRLQVELDKKMALIFALRAREQVRKSVVRRVIKILLYFYVRSHRWRRPPALPVKPQQSPVWQFDQPAEQHELAATAAAIAAVNLRRRRALSNNY